MVDRVTRQRPRFYGKIPSSQSRAKRVLDYNLKVKIISRVLQLALSVPILDISNFQTMTQLAQGQKRRFMCVNLNLTTAKGNKKFVIRFRAARTRVGELTSTLYRYRSFQKVKIKPATSWKHSSVTYELIGQSHTFASASCLIIEFL
jgi:hypothetical protein